MTVEMIDASALRGKETTVMHSAAEGSVWASNPAVPIVAPLPVAAAATISAANVYIEGSADGGTVTIALVLHDMSAHTVTVQGTPDTVNVTANSTKAVTVPGSFTPAAHQVARLEITGTNPHARIAGIDYTH